MTLRVPRAPGDLRCLVYDLEIFPNYFLATMTDGEEWLTFEGRDLLKLAAFVARDDLVLAGYNSFDYDDNILRYICLHPDASPADLFRLSNRLIDPSEPGEERANMRLRYSETPWAYSIDYFQLINGKGSLKEHECRDGSDLVLDSPADFSKPLEAAQIPGVKRYCRHDVAETARMLVNKWELVTLRERLDRLFALGTRIYCLSEARLAQHVFVTLHAKRTGETKGKLTDRAMANPVNKSSRFNMTDVMSSRVEFATKPFRALHMAMKAGAVQGAKKAWELSVPGFDLSKPITLAGLEFQLGVGGIHSVDAPGRFASTDDELIIDLDVTSYYPSLIIEEGMYPAQVGPAFLDDMRMLRDIRVKAKRDGDKAVNEAMKIVINSTFGKLNDVWSPIRSTVHAHKVTITGQLFILMLVEALDGGGFKILSANTDGVTLLCPRSRRATDLAKIVKWWEKKTRMALEDTVYTRYIRRAINDYMALKEDGKIKYKGCFNPEAGKGDGRIIRDAAEAELLHGRDAAEVVRECSDVRKFLFYQRVKNGGDAYHGEERMGKTVRWYASIGGDPVRRRNPKGTWAVIPNGHAASLALDITGWTLRDAFDLDRSHYITAARELIASTLPKPPKKSKAKKKS